MSSQLWHRSAIADDLTNREAGVAEASRILIVGGGIAGLSAAIALADAGYSAELVESRADWPVTGAAITMHANGVRALGRLGWPADSAGPVPFCRSGAFTMRRATCFAQPISQICGAMSAPASA
jgi:NAD(P)-binding Rossmann-like domain